MTNKKQKQPQHKTKTKQTKPQKTKPNTNSNSKKSSQKHGKTLQSAPSSSMEVTKAFKDSILNNLRTVLESRIDKELTIDQIIDLVALTHSFVPPPLTTSSITPVVTEVISSPKPQDVSLETSLSPNDSATNEVNVTPQSIEAITDIIVSALSLQIASIATEEASNKTYKPMDPAQRGVDLTKVWGNNSLLFGFNSPAPGRLKLYISNLDCFQDWKNDPIFSFGLDYSNPHQDLASLRIIVTVIILQLLKAKGVAQITDIFGHRRTHDLAGFPKLGIAVEVEEGNLTAHDQDPTPNTSFIKSLNRSKVIHEVVTLIDVYDISEDFFLDLFTNHGVHEAYWAITTTKYGGAAAAFKLAWSVDRDFAGSAVNGDRNANYLNIFPTWIFAKKLRLVIVSLRTVGPYTVFRVSPAYKDVITAEAVTPCMGQIQIHQRSYWDHFVQEKAYAIPLWLRAWYRGTSEIPAKDILYWEPALTSMFKVKTSMMQQVFAENQQVLGVDDYLARDPDWIYFRKSFPKQAADILTGTSIVISFHKAASALEAAETKMALNERHRKVRSIHHEEAKLSISTWTSTKERWNMIKRGFYSQFMFLLMIFMMIVMGAIGTVPEWGWMAIKFLLVLGVNILTALGYFMVRIFGSGWKVWQTTVPVISEVPLVKEFTTRNVPAEPVESTAAWVEGAKDAFLNDTIGMMKEASVLFNALLFLINGFLKSLPFLMSVIMIVMLCFYIWKYLVTIFKRDHWFKKYESREIRHVTDSYQTRENCSLMSDLYEVQSKGPSKYRDWLLTVHDMPDHGFRFGMGTHFLRTPSTDLPIKPLAPGNKLTAPHFNTLPDDPKMARAKGAFPFTVCGFSLSSPNMDVKTKISAVMHRVGGAPPFQPQAPILENFATFITSGVDWDEHFGICEQYYVPLEEMLVFTAKETDTPIKKRRAERVIQDMDAGVFNPQKSQENRQTTADQQDAYDTRLSVKEFSTNFLEIDRALEDCVENDLLPIRDLDWVLGDRVFRPKLSPYFEKEYVTFFIKTDEAIRWKQKVKPSGNMHYYFVPRLIVMCPAGENHRLHLATIDITKKFAERNGVTFTANLGSGTTDKFFRYHYVKSFDADVLGDTYTEALEWVGASPERDRVFFFILGDDSITIKKDKKGLVKAYQGDYSQYDASQHAIILKLVIWFMENILRMDTLSLEILESLLINNKKYKMSLGKGLEKLVLIREEAMQYTGIATTSVGNSIANLMLLLFAVLSCWDEDFSEIEGIMASLGIKIKLRQDDSPDGAEFLKGIFYPSVLGGYRWAPVMGQIFKLSKLLRDPISIFKDTQVNSYRKGAISLSLSMGVSFEYPILGRMLKGLWQFGNSIDMTQAEKDVTKNVYKVVNATYSSLDDKTIFELFSRRYGLSIDDLFILDDFLKQPRNWMFKVWAFPMLYHIYDTDF